MIDNLFKEFIKSSNTFYISLILIARKPGKDLWFYNNY